MNTSDLHLSVIIATPDNYQVIAKTIYYLKQQTLKEKLEIVIVAPSKQTLNLDESELKDFGHFQIVEIGEIPSVGLANAEGVRHATAPVVALAETHAYPQPNWAESLLKAHQQGWKIVGPSVVNANPDSTISWASFLIAYSPWMSPLPSGIVDDLPGHNSSYRRVILREYDAELPILLETESVLHEKLKKQGHKLYLASDAQIYHLNPSRLTSCLGELFYYGRLFGAARAQNWSYGKRLIYSFGSPLIPIVRLKYLLPLFYKAQSIYVVSYAVLIPIFIGLIAASLGEMLGYSWGAGKAMKQLRDFEYYRERHLAKSSSFSLT